MATNSATVNLEFTISDPDLCAEPTQYPSGPECAEFPVTAMKIGVMALRQAQGRIDAEQVRREGDHFIENLSQALTSHQKEVTEQMANCLKTYFDPQGGRFNKCVQRLVGKDASWSRSSAARSGAMTRNWLSPSPPTWARTAR